MVGFVIAYEVYGHDGSLRRSSLIAIAATSWDDAESAKNVVFNAIPRCAGEFARDECYRLTVKYRGSIDALPTL